MANTPAPAPNDERRLIRVYLAADPADARLVAQWLEQNGIEATVQGELMWAARGEIPVGPSTGPSVWTWEEQAVEARRLLDQRPKDVPGTPAWVCPGCGEEVEGQFTDCWNCGAQRAQA